MADVSDFTQLGVSARAEALRYGEVRRTVRQETARQEVLANLAAYQREFLHDEPVSMAHTYYHFNGRLYSQDNPHPLFEIRNQIDSREREGRTLAGFTAFETLINNGVSADEVFLWYSPAGRAGFEPPFDKIQYDSGRLYLGFKNSQDCSAHIDLKIAENRFPIVAFLNYLQAISGQPARIYQSPQEAKDYYLQHPLKSGLTGYEFFRAARNFLRNQQIPLEQTAYVSRRDSPQKQTHSFEEMFMTIWQQLGVNKNDSLTQWEWPGIGENRVIRSEEILQLYLAQIAAYMQKYHLYKIMLYGCSASSQVERSTLFPQAISQLFVSSTLEAVLSSYSTAVRLLSGSGLKNKIEENSTVSITCPCGKSFPCNIGQIKEAGVLQCPHCHLKTTCWEAIIDAQLAKSHFSRN